MEAKVFSGYWLLTIITTFLVACSAGGEKDTTKKTHLRQRGGYLVTVMGCHDCHTPKVLGSEGMPVPDMARQLSGHPGDSPYPSWAVADMRERNAVALTDANMTAWAGPWGVSFAANLTPDPATGIGEWSEETFIQAMRTGKHQGQPNGRDILPPMPWANFKQATEEDLKSIWAYLRSISPTKNQVPFPVPPKATK